MELCNACTLQSRLMEVQRGLQIQSVESLTEQLLEVLRFLQLRGVNHGDFHLKNIMLAEDNINVIDFGMSSAVNCPQLDYSISFAPPLLQFLALLQVYVGTSRT